MLQEDPEDTSVKLLLRISQQLETLVPTSATNIPLTSLSPNDFSTSASAVKINILWFLSLILSLASALMGIFLKQWLRTYTSWTEISPAQSAVALRHVYHKSFNQWGVPRLRAWVQALLQIALVLFLSGLLQFLWTLNHLVFGFATGAVGISLGFALLTVALPLFSKRCPWKSPLAWLIAHPILRMKRWYSSFTGIFCSLGRRPRSTAYVPLPQSWSEKDERTLIMRPVDFVYPNWHPQHQAIADIIGKAKVDTLIGSLTPCLPSVSEPALAIKMCSALLGLDKPETLQRWLNHDMVYNTDEYYVSSVRVQERLVTLHPRVIQLLAQLLSSSLELSSDIPFKATDRYPVEQVASLLDIILWSTDHLIVLVTYPSNLIGILEQIAHSRVETRIPLMPTQMKLARFLVASVNHKSVRPSSIPGESAIRSLPYVLRLVVFIDIRLRVEAALRMAPVGAHPPSSVYVAIVHVSLDALARHSATPDGELAPVAQELIGSMTEVVKTAHKETYQNCGQGGPLPWLEPLHDLLVKNPAGSDLGRDLVVVLRDGYESSLLELFEHSYTALRGLLKHFGLAELSKYVPPNLGNGPHQPALNRISEVPGRYGLESAYTADGRKYYVDHVNRTTVWKAPEAHSGSLGPLPPGWKEREAVRDGRDVRYYVDYKTGTVDWVDPRRRRNIHEQLGHVVDQRFELHFSDTPYNPEAFFERKTKGGTWATSRRVDETNPRQLRLREEQSNPV
jgi:hypothetical protein